MKRNVWAFLMRHLRLGYVSGLLVVDGFTLLFLVYDVYRFEKLDLSVGFALRLSRQLLQSYVGRYCVFLALLLVLILPILVAIFRVLAGPYPRASRILGRRSRSILVLHLACGAIIGYSPAFLTAMSVASGYKGISGSSYAFTSYLLQTEGLLFSYGFAYGLTVLTVLFTIILGILIQGTPPPYLKNYDLKVSLADLVVRFINTCGVRQHERSPANLAICCTNLQDPLT